MNILIAPALGVFGLIVAFIVFSLVMRYSDGTDQVKKIGDEIHKGAMKFMKTEYCISSTHSYGYELCSNWSLLLNWKVCHCRWIRYFSGCISLCGATYIPAYIPRSFYLFYFPKIYWWPQPNHIL